MQPKITPEEFEDWRAHPITKWVFAGIARGAELQSEEWMNASWLGGSANQLLLVELRTRADAYRALLETSYERWSELNESADA